MLAENDGSDLREFIQARLDRAGEHIDEFQRDFESLQQTDRMRLVPQMNVDKTQISIHVLYRCPHPNRRWGVIVGDIAHDLRSALDNSVYGIALMHTTGFPLPDNRRLAFPIADTEEDWEREQSRIRTLPENVRALISDAQPCHGGNRSLSLLGHLNDMDKHRLPVVAAAAIAGGNMPTFNDRVGSYPNITVMKGPAISDAPVLVFSFAEPQPPNMDVQLTLSLKPFLLHGNQWLPVAETLKEVRGATESTVDILKPFISQPVTQ
ncbi:MAG TPA: hypothetical protein VGE81_03205 [Candidatus Limnocylindrales bacterium]